MQCSFTLQNEYYLSIKDKSKLILVLVPVV